MRTPSIVLIASVTALICGYGLGWATGPNVEERLVRQFTEAEMVGCKPIKYHSGSMLCGVLVVPNSHEILEELARSNDETRKDPRFIDRQSALIATNDSDNAPLLATIDCRVWKPSVRWFTPKAVHSCSLAAG